MKIIYLLLSLFLISSCSTMNQGPKTLLDGKDGWVYINSSKGIRQGWKNKALYYCKETQKRYHCKTAEVKNEF